MARLDGLDCVEHAADEADVAATLYLCESSLSFK